MRNLAERITTLGEARNPPVPLGPNQSGTVSRILGHADFATRANVYAHLPPAILDRAAERMDAILGA